MWISVQIEIENIWALRGIDRGYVTVVKIDIKIYQYQETNSYTLCNIFTQSHFFSKCT